MKHCRVRIQLGLLLVLSLARPLCAQSPTPSPNEKKTISIAWLGYAAFEIMALWWDGSFDRSVSD